MNAYARALRDRYVGHPSTATEPRERPDLIVILNPEDEVRAAIDRLRRDLHGAELRGDVAEQGRVRARISELEAALGG